MAIEHHVERHVSASGVVGWSGAKWISRAVPPGQRIIRAIARSGIDWAEPGSTLGQTFRTDGQIVALNIDVAGPDDVPDPHQADVAFTVSLQSAEGQVIAERSWEGPQLVWDFFGQLLEVNPPAPPGEYVVTLRSTRGRIGWYRAKPQPATADDGVSPLPVIGTALADGRPVDGIRTLGVDTPPAPNPLFRRTFPLSELPASATLAATVLGTGVVKINGTRVGDEALEPAVTDYDHTVLFRTWEVAHLLREGENEIMVSAGRERWAARGGDVWGWNLASWHREPTALAVLTMVAEDGAIATVVTDEAWRAAPGPVESEMLFRGEDWVFTDAAPNWEPVVVVDPPSGQLQPAKLPPVRAGLPVAPITVERRANGSVVYDFGTVMVGRIRCVVTGAPGGTIRVVSGEQRDQTGTVICDNFLIAGEAQVDSLRLESPAREYVWEPQYGYRGFRWMQVWTEGEVTVEAVRAVPLYTEVDRVGEFSAEEPLLEWIDDATGRTFLNNLHGVPTDTPIYEKNGWTADAHLATEGLLHHFDLRAAFGKWMDDHADAQGADGSIPQIIPTPGWGRATDPAWSSSAVLIPWYLYREYGDLDVLEGAAPMVRRFADQLTTRLDGGLWPDRSWADWLAPGYQIAPEGMMPTGTTMSVLILNQAAAILRELGDEAGAAGHEATASAAGAAYHEKYFDHSTGHYSVPHVGYRQSLNILPLAFGVVPDEHVDSVRAALIDDLEHRTDGHIDCGAVGVRHLLPVLSAAGRDDLAITVLTRRTRPGWGVWFDQGESTLLESWDVDARSRNHYFLGSVAAWIQQRVGGMQLTAPGWSSFDIAPVDDPRVRRARIRHRTPHGEASVDWERGPGGWLFRVTVPVEAIAQIRVPGHEHTLESGKHVVRLND